MTKFIETEVSIYPYEIAGMTVNEVERFLGDSVPEREWYLDELVRQAERNFVENPQFKKKLMEVDCAQGFLYMVMRSWFVKLLKQRSPSIYKALPPTFYLEMPVI